MCIHWASNYHANKPWYFITSRMHIILCISEYILRNILVRKFLSCWNITENVDLVQLPCSLAWFQKEYLLHFYFSYFLWYLFIHETICRNRGWVVKKQKLGNRKEKRKQGGDKTVFRLKCFKWFHKFGSM